MARTLLRVEALGKTRPGLILVKRPDWRYRWGQIEISTCEEMRQTSTNASIGKGATTFSIRSFYVTLSISNSQHK
jgi:hypothetical protein